jgi:hypothetical protein
MKKSIFSLLMLSLLVMMTNSCSKSNPSSSGGKYSWSCEVNGKSYSWSGSYPDGTNPSSMGLSTFSETILMLSLPAQQGKLPFSFSVIFGDIPSSGTYTFDDSNSDTEYACSIIENSTIGTTAAPGSNMKVTIPNIPSNTYINTQGANPGLIKGTFSGTLYAINPSNPSTFIKYVITNGKYEAIVLN